MYEVISILTYFPFTLVSSEIIKLISSFRQDYGFVFYIRRNESTNVKNESVVALLHCT